MKRSINVLSQEVARLCGIDYSELETVPGTKVLIEQGTRCNRRWAGKYRCFKLLELNTPIFPVLGNTIDFL